MKKYIKVIFTALIISFVIDLSTANAKFFDMNEIKAKLFEKPASWEFMQSVGGIKVGQPIKKNSNTTFLPIKCDISGTQTITRKPTTMNSALGVYQEDARIGHKQILISVSTSLISSKYDPQCKGLNLKNVRSGKYDIFYYDLHKKHLINTVTFP